MFILTVKELFSSIKINLETKFPFVMVRGDVVNLNYDARGNLYFLLKDIGYSISCVCWKGKFPHLTINPLQYTIENKEVIIKGLINVYKSSTKISIEVIDINIEQEAAISLLLEEKKLKLRNLGYFEQSNKKDIPLLSKLIGLITSKEGKVVSDVTNTIKERFPSKVLLYNVSVQGCSSANSIAKALRYFNSLETKKKPNVLIIARGGGSFEDLLPFYEEDLVEAIFNSTIPVITAIGHSTDTTFADYTADKYAITPTAAAEIVTQITILHYKRDIKIFNKKLEDILLKKINNYIIKQQLLETKFINCKLYFSNKYSKIIELKNLSTLLLKEIYRALYYKLSSIKNKILEKTIASLFHKTTYLKYATRKLQSPILNINKNNNQLKFVTVTFYKQKDLILNQKMQIYKYLDNSLKSLSYTNTLKRGFTLIKKSNSDVLIKTSSELSKEKCFDIVFLDKTINITKN